MEQTKIKKTLKQKRLPWLMVVFCLLSFHWQYGQDLTSTKTYTYETKYQLKRAYNFKPHLPHGIKADHYTGWTKIRIEVKTKDKYKFVQNAGTTYFGTVLLYEAYIHAADAGNELKHTGGSEGYWVKDFFNYWSTKDAKTDSQTFYRNQAFAVDCKIPSSGWGRWGHDNIDVIATVTIEGGGSLRDIKEIKVPGSDPWDGGHFINYTSPCTDSDNLPISCDAVADFKNVSNAENQKPIVVAHRGYHGMRGDYPENSLAALKKAYEEGFRYVELDLRMTKDNVPIIFHDDWLGYVTDFPTKKNNDHTTETEKRTWAEINHLYYRSRYWNRDYENAIVANNPFLRLGGITNEKFNSFSQICDYLKDKDIMLYLDIKLVPTERNLEVMKHCLHIAVEKNVLHQIALKAIRTNQNAPAEKQLEMYVQTVKNQLGGVYSKLKNHLNIHVIDYRLDNPIFVNQWLLEGNIVGFEFDGAHNEGLLMAPAFASKIFEGGRSAWEYTKWKGYRTGIWSSAPIDPRGRPGHDPSQWGTGNAMKLTNPPNEYFRYMDSRSRMEIQMMVTPQYITHDRPDTWASYLKAINMYNTNTEHE